MSKEDIKKLIKYWVETAKHDYETMISLFKSKRYSDSLFYGHIVLEKNIKGNSSQRNKKASSLYS